MTQIKESYSEKEETKKETKKDVKDFEFGAIIKNDAANHPNVKSWKNQAPVISDKCIGCGTCVQVCPEGALVIKEVKGKKRCVVNYDLCKGEGMCATVCPTGAIEMKKFKK